MVQGKNLIDTARAVGMFMINDGISPLIISFLVLGDGKVPSASSMRIVVFLY